MISLRCQRIFQKKLLALKAFFASDTAAAMRIASCYKKPFRKKNGFKAVFHGAANLLLHMRKIGARK